MIDEREIVRVAVERLAPPEPAYERLVERRDRKRRNQRIGAGTLAIILALVSFVALTRAFRSTERPADEPTPKPQGIFSEVGGWIAYGNESVKHGPPGIWAVDPTRPNDPEARIQLSRHRGTPLAWSNDGSGLLIWRRRQGPVGTPGCPRCAGPDWTGLFVLNADGTETRLVVHRPSASYIFPGGSFSPDGSEVVFATHPDSIYTVDADGGTPRILREHEASIEFVALESPTFSPDGTKIAFVEFRDLPGHTLRVMNADGTGDLVLLDSQAVNCIRPNLLRPAWSPDGTQIAFSCSRVTGIQVVSADGSDLTTVIPNGGNPYWSPDGSRIAFEVEAPPVGRRLAIADADGTHVQVFQYPAVAGPWNPLLPAVPGEANPTATSSGLAAPFVYAIAVLGAVGILVIAWRARRRIATR